MSTNKCAARTAASFLGKPAAAIILGFIFTFSLSAQSVRTKATADSILGVKIGMTAGQADEALESVGINPAGEGKGVGESEDGETKEAWVIKGTKFSQVVLMRDSTGHVAWVSGFVRSGQSIDFKEFGDLSAAVRSNPNQAVWNVLTPAGGYKLVAKGRDGRANVVYLISFASPPVE